MGQCFEYYQFFGEKFRILLFTTKFQWYQYFLIKIMPRNLCFYDRKMNWTFLFILVQVHSISELSSVQVLSAKKWTEFSSKFTLLKKNLVQFTNLKMNFSVHFSVHLKNISKGSMPKSGTINSLEVFLWDNVLNIINFFGKSLWFFFYNKIPMVLVFFDQKYAKKPWSLW